MGMNIFEKKLTDLLLTFQERGRGGVVSRRAKSLPFVFLMLLLNKPDFFSVPDNCNRVEWSINWVAIPFYIVTPFTPSKTKEEGKVVTILMI